MALLTWEQAEKKAEDLHNEGKKIVFTNGCFDILHPGHLRLFEWAKSRGDVLFVAINSDSSIKRLKGPSRPINNEHIRAEMILNLKPVDFVVVFGNNSEENDTPLELIKKIKPDILVKGGDWAGNVVGADFVKANGGKVEMFPTQEGHSTTNTIKTAVEKHKLKE